MLLPGSQDWMLQSGLALEANLRARSHATIEHGGPNQAETAIAAQNGESGTVGCGGNLPIYAGSTLTLEALKRSIVST